MDGYRYVFADKEDEFFKQGIDPAISWIEDYEKDISSKKYPDPSSEYFYEGRPL